MKLINKALFYYLLVSFPLLIATGFLSYYMIREEVREDFDEELLKEKQQEEKVIMLNPEASIYYLSSDSNSIASPVSFHKNETIFSDSAIFDVKEEEMVNYRVLRSYCNINKQTWLITKIKPSTEEEELAEGLFSAFAVMGLFLMLAFFLISWVISKKIWRPFYETVQKLNAYKVKEHSRGNFNHSEITEFDQLNNALNQMTEKIYDDFRRQKEFTENASHEIQTPLAIIKSNLSLLMQSPNMKMEEMNRLQTIENTIKRLAAINKTLLLLTKIDNDQFKENTNLDLAIVVKKVLAHFEDLLVAKHMTVENSIAENIPVSMNPTLAEILVTNLVQNAIRHNMNGGKILIRSESSLLEIANTGQPLNIDPADLFTRFKKNDASKESLGLGLAIVHSITGLYHYSISYDYKNALHIFTLKF